MQIVFLSYLFVSIIVTIIGMALLYRNNKLICQSSMKVKIRWSQYVIHILSLALLASAACYQVFSNKSAWFWSTTIYPFFTTLYYLIVMWIIYSQAASEDLNRYECFLTRLPDGQLHFTCRLKPQQPRRPTLESCNNSESDMDVYEQNDQIRRLTTMGDRASKITCDRILL